MSERPNVSPEENLTDSPAGIEQNELSAASQAASEHALNDSELGDGYDTERLRGELDAQKIEHAALHDKYVRLHAEFDNFRRRTAKERMDLLQTASAEALKSILPVLDDMERAAVNNVNVNDIDAIKQGFDLIQQKFSNILMAQGLKPMKAKGEVFNSELHEAITKAPAPSAALKGKVIDVVENGYTLHDKVIRYAKVVVGE